VRTALLRYFEENAELGFLAAMPFTSTAPRSRYSKRLPTRRRVPAVDDRVRLGQRLQPGGEVRRLTVDRLFLRRAFPDQIADDHQPGGDPDPRFELDGSDIEATDSVYDAQPSPDRPISIILMRSRVAEMLADQRASAASRTMTRA
jgi:hypothetical protein